MSDWYNRLQVWQQVVLWAVGFALLFAITFTVISGEPKMALGGLITGALSGPAVYRYVKKSSERW